METNESLISIALGMGQQKNGLALSNYLVETCAGYLNGAVVMVLEIYGLSRSHNTGIPVNLEHLSVRRFDDASPRPRSLDLSGLQETLLRMLPEARKNRDGECRLLVPLTTETGPHRVLVFDNIDESPMVRTAVLQISELYSNQMRLLDSRERDPLTGLLNRQTFAQYFQSTAKHAIDAGEQLWLGVFDIDHFKRINDTWGHNTGDVVLRGVAAALREAVREADLPVRLGGEEFAVFILGESARHVGTMAERVRRAVEQLRFEGELAGQHVTLSAGVASRLSGEDLETLIGRADRALYEAKNSGRNRVCADPFG